MAVIYTCSMHREVHETGPGKCPKCRMGLRPEGTGLALLRDILTPQHLFVMLGLIIMMMAAVMMVGHF